MRAILECLLSRDPARAEAACRDHVRKAAEVAKAIFRTSA
jgi:DNA-binding GntR family transcriptional regulator